MKIALLELCMLMNEDALAKKLANKLESNGLGTERIS